MAGLDDFELDQMLGEGSTAKVYRAVHIPSDPDLSAGSRRG
ncbi:MAG: hypothetical protein ACOYBY_18955 [Dermatophilaceae bacterium]